MAKFKFMVEDLTVFEVTIEVEDQGDTDLNQEAATDVFDNLPDPYEHPTCVDHDGYRDVQCYELDDSETKLEKLTGRMSHEDMDD